MNGTPYVSKNYGYVVRIAAHSVFMLQKFLEGKKEWLDAKTKYNHTKGAPLSDPVTHGRAREGFVAEFDDVNVVLVHPKDCPNKTRWKTHHGKASPNETMG